MKARNMERTTSVTAAAMLGMRTELSSGAW